MEEYGQLFKSRDLAAKLGVTKEILRRGHPVVLEPSMQGMQKISVQDPWFTAIAQKRKTIEGRLLKGKFAALRPGTVLVVDKPNSKRRLVAVVTKVAKYPTFEAYLSSEGLNRTLPGVKTIRDGVDVYRRFYSEQDERNFGVVAIHITLAP